MTTIVNWHEFQVFLQEIGRDSGPLVLALFPPDPSKPCIHYPCTGDALPIREIERDLHRHRELSLGMVLNRPLPRPDNWGSKPHHLNRAGKPKTWGASDAQIAKAVGILSEFDGGLPLEAQLSLPKLAGLPEPSLCVWSGSKSLHLYWLLAAGEVLEPATFKELQRRLAARFAEVAPDAKPDTSICNPARLMRAPGGLHPKTDQRCEIHSRTGQRFTVAELLDLLPEPIKAPPLARTSAPVSRGQGEPVPIHELLPRELRRTWEQGAPAGHRNQTAFALAASLLAVHNAAAAAGLVTSGTPENSLLQFASRCQPPLPDQEALSTLSSACSAPRTTDPGWPERLRFQLNRQARGQRQQQHVAATPKALLEKFPAAVERHQKRQKTAAAAPPVQVNPYEEQREGFESRCETMTRRGKRKLSHTRRMACFDRCVFVLAARERNSLRRRAALLRAVKALELDRYINRQEISQRVLEAKDQQQGNSYRGLTAADRLAMDWPEVEWLIPDLVPANDLSIIGGRPKVGKTAVGMAIAAAVLKGGPFAGFAAPTKARPVIVVSDDQGDADTKKAMDELEIFDHPLLIWSRRFRLTESDLDQLLADVRLNPGALVIIDSLRSVSRALKQGENDPEIGAVIYDLKAAVLDAGGSLLLIHHNNKAAGLTGVEALSGHNAIAGAANTVITMHYVDDANGKPQKEAEQRRLVREGRTGKPLDLVISRTAGSANFHLVSTHTQWLEQLEETSKQEQREARQTATQMAVLETLEVALGRWLTCREVVEALGLDWGERGNGKDPVRVREALNRLAAQGDIQRVRAGNQYTFAAKTPRAQIVSTTSTTSAPLQDKGSDRREATSAASAAGNTHDPAKVAEIEPLQRTPLQRCAAEEVEAAEEVDMPSQPVEVHHNGAPKALPPPTGIRTSSEWVEAACAELHLAPHFMHLPQVMAWFKVHPAAPAISKREVSIALERLHADEQAAEQTELFDAA